MKKSFIKKGNPKKPGYVPGFLGKVPLERALSKLGIASRSRTKALITEGCIKVDGNVVRDPLFMVVPEKAKIMVNGKIVVKTAWQAIMLYKPRGYVTTASDEKGRKTIYDLLPAHLKHLHPVGRLDMATSGLLILTTDTKMSDFLTDPKNAIERTYAVTVEGKMTKEKVAGLMAGIVDEGETLKPLNVLLRKTSNTESHLIMTLTEGKNREIRRMMSAVGHEVMALKRIAFGKLTLGTTTQPGEYKQINKEDIL